MDQSQDKNNSAANSTKAVQVTLRTDWAQAVTRSQQLVNEGCRSVSLVIDDDGRVVKVDRA